jgi:hypothetical protein
MAMNAPAREHTTSLRGLSSHLQKPLPVEKYDAGEDASEGGVPLFTQLPTGYFHALEWIRVRSGAARPRSLSFTLDVPANSLQLLPDFTALAVQFVLREC